MQVFLTYTLHRSIHEQSGPRLEREKSVANKEQLSILTKGVEAWNGWRAKNIYVYADLNEADLNELDLIEADLRIAHLRRANLFRADLSRANLSGADLSDADLREANLSQADLTKANLNGANLNNAFVRDANLRQANLLAANLRNANLSNSNIGDANLVVANLEGADLTGANLNKTDLTKADLSGIRLRQTDLSGTKLSRAILTSSNLLEAKFIEADLTGADFSQASVGNTVFVNSNLSQAIGLESVDHRGPSHISMDTFLLSEGKIPEVFLRGCGLSDLDIEYAKLSNPELGMEEIDKILYKIRQLRAARALQISPLFISYSDADSSFVDKVGNSLTKKGIRFWHHIHDRKAGRMEIQIDRAIRQNPRVLLVLSESSLSSDWVEHEVRTARALEKEIGRDVLCPVALDDSWQDSRGPKWLMEEMTEDNILDFSAWKDNGRFEDMFRTLIDGLELFYKG
jgi:uncharacterized protein YjbI with pentapeptide repeats